MTDEFTVEAVTEGRAVRLALGGELDLACSAQLAEAITEHAHPGSAIVLDLRELTFMDSTGLSVVINADNTARAEGWELAIIEGDGPVRRLFDLTDTRSLLRFVATSDELDG